MEEEEGVDKMGHYASVVLAIALALVVLLAFFREFSETKNNKSAVPVRVDDDAKRNPRTFR